MPNTTDVSDFCQASYVLPFILVFWGLPRGNSQRLSVSTKLDLIGAHRTAPASFIDGPPDWLVNHILPYDLEVVDLAFLRRVFDSVFRMLRSLPVSRFTAYVSDLCVFLCLLT